MCWLANRQKQRLQPQLTLIPTLRFLQWELYGFARQHASLANRTDLRVLTTRFEVRFWLG